MTINLDSLIPTSGVGDSYRNRELPGGFTDHDVMDAAMASGHNVGIYGPTGTGKTHAARAFAAKRGLPFYTIACNQAFDMSAIFGSWQPTADGSLEWVDGVLTTMAREGRGVVLVDEINMAAERALARLYGLFDSRREIVLYEHSGEVIRIPAGSDFVLISAWNPGYRGTRELSQALPNRMAFVMEFDYDDEVEADLIFIPAVREMARKLRTMSREIRTPVSTNMQVEFCEIALAFNVDFAMANWTAKFAEAERESVAQICHLHKAAITAQLDAFEREMGE